MTINPDGPPDVSWTLQSFPPRHLDWSDDSDYWDIKEARRVLAERKEANPQVAYRLIEATTSYRVVI